MRADLLSKEQREILAWRESPTENPAADSPDNIINKLGDAAVFLEALKLHREIFHSARRILELGCGQGWASCLVRRLFESPSQVIASDISRYAIAGVRLWERVFSVRLDAAFAARSYELPIAGDSIDLVFTFAAAHHFVAHRRTLTEIHRVLAPGGHALYLHEPTCHRVLYPLAHHRVNGRRMPVPEDVLVYSEIERLAHEVGLDVSSLFDVSLTKRGPVETLYYAVLRSLSPLQGLLPCTRHILFRKPLPALR